MGREGQNGCVKSIEYRWGSDSLVSLQGKSSKKERGETIGGEAVAPPRNDWQEKLLAWMFFDPLQQLFAPSLEHVWRKFIEACFVRHDLFRYLGSQATTSSINGGFRDTRVIIVIIRDDEKVKKITNRRDEIWIEILIFDRWSYKKIIYTEWRLWNRIRRIIGKIFI